MVKRSVFPVYWSMTGFTFLPIFSVMFIVLIMAGIATLRRGLHVCNGAGIQVALGAGNICMTTFKFEGIGIMVKIVKAIHPIMTGNAVGTERE